SCHSIFQQVCLNNCFAFVLAEAQVFQDTGCQTPGKPALGRCRHGRGFLGAVVGPGRGVTSRVRCRGEPVSKACQENRRLGGWLMRSFYVLASVAILAGCGGGSSSGVGSQGAPPELAAALQLAAVSDVTVGTIAEGVTPFISLVQLGGNSLANMTSMSYTIAPKPGTVSNPVAVTFTADALSRLDAGLVSGSLSAITTVLPFSGTRAPATVVLPVFGLYSGYENSVSIQIFFTDGSAQTIPLTLVTSAYTDPNKIYDHPVIIKKRAPGAILGFDFFAMKSNLGTPVIVDTDGEIRWVGGPGTASGLASILVDNGFVIGDQ